MAVTTGQHQRCPFFAGRFSQCGDAAQRAGIAIYQLVTDRPDLAAAFLKVTAGKAAIR